MTRKATVADFKKRAPKRISKITFSNVRYNYKKSRGTA